MIFPKKKIRFVLFILASILLVYGVYSVSVFIIRKNSPIILQVSPSEAASLKISCYPVLFDGDVVVTQEETIQNLISAIDHKKFSYWCTVRHRNGFFNRSSMTGGHFNNFTFYDSQGNQLAAFGYDGSCGGYIVERDGLIYKLTDEDTEIEAQCSNLISRAENNEFPRAVS